MTTSIEHDEYGRVDGVIKRPIDDTSTWFKDGRRFCVGDGWREVPQPRNVTGEFTPIERWTGLKQVNGNLKREGSLIAWGSLPAGCSWSKDQAIVLPEDLGELENNADFYDHPNGKVYVCYQDVKDWLKQYKTPVLTIWEGAR